MGGDREYTRTVLRRSAAQVCQVMGWHAAHSQALEVLVHATEKFITKLATRSHAYAEQDNRTHAGLPDLALAFADLNVSLPELRDYLAQVPASPARLAPPPYPLPRSPRLHFLKPGSREVLTRPVHIPEYLPPVTDEKERERDELPREVELPPDPGSPERPDPFKRPADPTSPHRKPRTKSESDDVRSREITSVIMTMSGFLSPAREGRLPEARTPMQLAEPAPERQPRPPFRPVSADRLYPPSSRPPEVREPKKSKTVNGKTDKSEKKARSRKSGSKKKVSDVPANKLAAHLARGKSGPSAPAPAPAVLPPEYLSPVPRPRLPVPSPVPAVPSVPPSLPPPVPPIVSEPPLDLIPARMIKKEIEEPDPPPISPPLDGFDPAPIEFPFRIPKEEPPDPEKLTTRPDRAKLTIFKKISTKNREEQRPPDFFDDAGFGGGRYEQEDKLSIGRRSHAPESVPDFVHDRVRDFEDGIRSDPSERFGRDGIVGVEDSHQSDLVIAEKKEKKRKDKKTKAERSSEKELAKMLKKRRKEEAIKLAAAAVEPVANLASNFPLYPPMIPGPGLIPTPGLIPGGGLFPSLVNNPMLQSMIRGNGPNLLPNPFSGTSAGDLPTPALLPSAPGLIPPPIGNPLLNHINHGFGQPPRMPQYPNLPAFLRRPSLEVIPLDENDPQSSENPSVSPPLVIREKDKPEKFKSSFSSEVLNTFANFDGPKHVSKPVQMPNVTPDITIKLNPPEKSGMSESDIDPNVMEENSQQMKEKSEKKKDKLHKKEKKDKEQKIKKKKDKKEKLRLKLEKRKEKEERHDLKEKLKKEKKEKRREKERILMATEGIVPKLTLKLGSSSPMIPSSPETTRKLNIKPIIKREPSVSPVPMPQVPDEINETDRSHSPELARISALVTRPPKSKSFIKHTIKMEYPESNIESSSAMQTDTPTSRKHRPPSSSTKYKRIFFKPIPKRNSDFDESALDSEMVEMPPSESIINTIPPNIPLGTPFYMDPHGNKIWICPACGHPDNGSPMIGCDGCDGWYHWICVGIHVAPDDSEDWYCTSCIAKRTAMVSALAGGQTGKKRGRKPKAEKMREIQ